MKILLKIALLAATVLCIHKDQFLKNLFVERKFGPVQKVEFLPGGLAAIFNSLGFSLIDLNTGKEFYHIDERIDQVFVTSTFKAYIFNKNANKLYLFNLKTGQLEKNIKFDAQNFEKFLFNDNKIYFIRKNNIFMEDEEKTFFEAIFEKEINASFFNTKTNMLYVS